MLLFVLTACSLGVTSSPPTVGPTVVLFTYQTPTPTQLFPIESGADEDLSTPTPATYKVAEGDTLIGIATRLGISLDALRAANPGVEPRLLTPGMTLLLPAEGGTALPIIPTPTPVAVTMEEARCYASTAGELWCFVYIENNLPTAVENLTAAVHLLSADGEVISTLQATPPLNLLGPGEALPLVAYSPDLPGGWVAARGQLLSAYSLAAGSDYYLAAVIQGSNIDFSEDGLAASVAGRVEIQGEAKTIWVLAVAYDDQGEIVGVRRWESAGETEFDFTVYSLGPAIADVDLLVEARP